MFIFNFIRNLFKGLISSKKEVSLNEINTIYDQLSKQGKNGAYAVFIPLSPRENEIEVLNIQFSIVQDNIGLDWVLVSPINIANQNVFLAAAKSLCYEVANKEDNGVNYLRVEGDKAPIMCKLLLANLYNLGINDNVQLITEGFTWTSGVN